MRNLFFYVLALAGSFNAFAREDTRLDSDWRFKKGDVGGAEQVDFADADWETVTLPHNWGWEEAQEGRNYYRGPGWYRRTLALAPESGRRYFLRFEAAGSVADVYLNGKSLGQHRGAFGAFGFELTRNLSDSGTNVVAVRVSNARENDIAPLSGDFCVFGGLYRPVHLIETSEQNFALTDHGSPGVAWLQTSVTDSRASLDIVAQISNSVRTNLPLTLAAIVLDVNGNRAAGAEQPITVISNVTAPFSLKLTVPQPRLWNGRKDPYLYRAIVELRSPDGVLDSVEQPLGLRYFSVDPDKGFFLNGKPYHLHGVNRHQDRLDKGWAITEADQDEDMRMVFELGCTAIRCAHYQHSDYFYSLCDKAGILVWAELPQVNEIDPSPQFAETSRNQLIDLIRQNINHPSIFAWSLFNELWPGRPDPHRELQDLKIVANGEDPTRPTIAATSHDKLPQMIKIPDWLGWNIYPGWYADWGPKEDFGPLMDRGRYISRNGGLCISEYGAGANILHHEENPQKPPRTTGQWHPEEWQNVLHEAAWGAMKTRPYIWGTFVWVMFDFTSYYRREGGIPGRNDKGLVTYDRKTKKDAFYFYQANWSDEPMIYITSRRYAERTNALTNVKIYSNAGEVELLLNGVTQGKRRDAANGVFVWNGVPLKPGANHIEARAERNGQKLTDECSWTLKAVQ
jgi:beta-galactosidase